MRLGVFENILSERNEGITMYKIKTKLFGRIAVVTALSLGLTASAVGVASASSRGHHWGHDRHSLAQTSSAEVVGVVSTYVAGSSISILAKGSTTPTTYTLTSATTIAGLATGTTLASSAVVELTLSTTTPVTVTAIKVKVPCAQKIEGVVSTYVAGSSISILAKGSTTPTTYTLTSATTIAGLATGTTLASSAVVELTLSTTTPVTVTAIKVKVPCDGHSNVRNGGRSEFRGSNSQGSSHHGFGGKGSREHNGSGSANFRN
jgi:hypothetical protein